tara:strand:- start:1794 stop:2789 length:996 start_codon:yes stop_codon:yes gene_type:complete
MIKILYAASNNYYSSLQLIRIINSIKELPVIIKVAAYKKSSPKNISIDWTLDSLLNINKPELLSIDNDNFIIYYDQIKNFNPDLIISDLEYFTSHIANLLNKPLWQCSSTLINIALTKSQKYDLGIFKKYAIYLNKTPVNVQKIINIIDNSNKNFIYSHFGDTMKPLEIKQNFQWLRPYYKLGKNNLLCKHNIVAALPDSNKFIINSLSKYQDSIIFTNNHNEKYNNILNKDINNDIEYSCNLHNSNIFVCEGQTTFLSDAFYNKKTSVIYPNYLSPESLINKTLSDYLKLSYDDINFDYPDLSLNLDSKIKFLHEEILFFIKENENDIKS